MPGTRWSTARPGAQSRDAEIGSADFGGADLDNADSFLLLANPRTLNPRLYLPNLLHPAVRCINEPMSDNTQIPIYTIGHGGRTLDHLIALLQRYEIAFLIDVRSPAAAQLPAFAKPTLAVTLPQQGIRYVDMSAALGEDVSDADPQYQHAIGRLRTAFTQQQRVVLLGQSTSPATCHRSHRIGATLAQLQIPVVHIDEAGALQPQSALTARSKQEGNTAPKHEVQHRSQTEIETPLAVLERVFGYDEFRPLQGQIVDNILIGKVQWAHGKNQME